LAPGIPSNTAANPLFTAAKEVQDFLVKNGWPFCFIGGLAVIRWGEMRITQDIDLCLQCGFGNEETRISSLLSHFSSRISDGENFARRYRVLLLVASNHVAIDVTLSGIPFEVEMIQRASRFAFSDTCDLITCSADDLVVLKAFADRTRDWMDVETIVQRQGDRLDQRAILSRLQPLCEAKEQPEIIKKLKRLFQTIV